MASISDFSEFFRVLWFHTPYPWQRVLAERLVEGEWSGGAGFADRRGQDGVHQYRHLRPGGAGGQSSVEAHSVAAHRGR